MPIFSYECGRCRKLFEYFHCGSQDTKAECPFCGSRDPKKLPTTKVSGIVNGASAKNNYGLKK